MKRYFDRNRNVLRKYRLSSIASESNGVLVMNVHDEMIYSLFFRFQGVKYRLCDAIKILEECAEDEVEIFPGIYFSYAIHNAYFRHELHFFFRKTRFIIRNENAKDSFEIKSEIERKMTISSRSGKSTNYQIENIDPQKVEQPVNLRGGECGGCGILNYFDYIGLDGEQQYNGYYFFSDAEILAATKNDTFFLEECCKNSGFYKKILEEGYSSELSDYYQIKIEYCDGKYFAGEGKHRICVMKRFGYNKKVPMMVTNVELIEQEGNTCNEEHMEKYYGDMKQILDSCYSQYLKLGISQDNVRMLLKKPDATVLDYLNASGYSYKEIRENYKPVWLNILSE